MLYGFRNNIPGKQKCKHKSGTQYENGVVKVNVVTPVNVVGDIYGQECTCKIQMFLNVIVSDTFSNLNSGFRLNWLL